MWIENETANERAENETAVRLRVITVVTAMHETKRDETNWLNGYHSDIGTLTVTVRVCMREILKMTYDLLWNFCLRC